MRLRMGLHTGEAERGLRRTRRPPRGAYLRGRSRRAGAPVAGGSRPRWIWRPATSDSTG
jgi:hypothetical protein